MSTDLLSVEQVAERLGLHARTVRNYVRDGRLKATRIGKQYRIASADLEAFAGIELAPVPRTRHVDVSSIVQIDAVGPDEAIRISNGLVGAANGRSPEDGPLRVETVYEQERGRLKIIVTGALAPVVLLMQLIDMYQQPA